MSVEATSSYYYCAGIQVPRDDLELGRNGKVRLPKVAKKLTPKRSTLQYIIWQQSMLATSYYYGVGGQVDSIQYEYELVCSGVLEYSCPFKTQ